MSNITKPIMLNETGELIAQKLTEIAESNKSYELLLKTKADKVDVSAPYNFKGAAAYDALPTSGNVVNDTYYCVDKKCKYTWNGEEWCQSSMSEADYTDELAVLSANLEEADSRLSSEIEEVNGYSSEYNITWIDNSYVNSDGTILEYSEWKRSDYIELVNTDYLYVSSDVDVDNECNGFFDANKKYIRNLYISAGSNKALIDYVPSNAKYVMVSCHKTKKIQLFPHIVSVDDVNKRLQVVEKAQESPIPSYYNEHLKEKNRKVNSIIDEMSNCVAFIFFTDQHLYSNTKNSCYLMQDIIANTSVRDVINGGDIISAYGTEVSIIDDCEKYRKYWGSLKPYYVRGNHDIYVKETDLGADGILKSNDMVINRFMRPFNDDMVIENGKTYYYFDRPQNKIRFVCLDTTENMVSEMLDNVWLPNFDHSISQEQVNWFIDLLKATPQDYKIVLCNHIPITSNIKWGSDFVYIFGDIVEAFNTKSTINKKDNYGITANADFSTSKGSVILSICGHGHTDDTYTSPSGCVYYEVNCDAYINNGGSEYAREVGTVTEQAFDVVIINADNGDIHTVRYGAGIDKTLVKH